MERIGILYVSDSEAEQHRISETLAGAGVDCAIHRVESADGASAALDAGGFDLILCDYFLKNLGDGQAAALAIGRRPEIPCIVVSTGIGDVRAVELMKSGVADYVPADRLDRLAAAVGRALEESRHRQSRRDADVELRRVLNHARCILWHGDVRGDAGWDDPASPGWPRAQIHWQVTVNDEAAARQFFTVEEPLGARYFDAWANSRHPEDTPRMDARAARAFIKGERSYAQEFRCREIGGRIRWFFEDVSIQKVGPAQWKTFGVVTDITQNKEAEEARAHLLEMEQKARAAAEQVNRKKDQFLAILSHELRTPLTPIIAAVGLLKMTQGMPEEGLMLVDMIRRNAELEARLVDDLLDLARLTNGKLVVSAGTVDVHAPLAAAIEAVGRDAEVMGVRLTSALSAANHWVRGDSGRLRQVFWHLIGNAVKFTPAGGAVAVRTLNLPAGEWAVEVVDNGIGIDAETLQRLFNAFEQGEQKLTRRYGGLGLGLTIAKSLVEIHGGKIEARSAGTNAGAVFTVTLPTVGEGAAGAGAAEGAGANGGRREPSAAR